VRLLRVELRRLLSRRTVRVLFMLLAVIFVIALVANYLHASDKEPLTEAFIRDGGLGFGNAFAVVSFVIGATSGGAEWAARTMEALLVWEPRRVRLMLAKVGALAIVVVTGAVVVQAVVGPLSRLAVAGRGVMPPGDTNLWSDYVGNSLTVIALAVLGAVFGFAIASLTRNTGFALGAAFVYAVVIEALLHLLPKWVLPFTLVSNIGAFVNHGLDLDVGPEGTLRLSMLRAGITLTCYVAGLFALATALFRRRDVT